MKCQDCKKREADVEITYEDGEVVKICTFCAMRRTKVLRGWKSLDKDKSAEKAIDTLKAQW